MRKHSSLRPHYGKLSDVSGLDYPPPPPVAPSLTEARSPPCPV